VGDVIVKKLLLSLFCLFLIQNLSFAKDMVQFDFPNAGWHKVASPDGVEAKKCYVPHNQTTEVHTEMLVFYERVLKNKGISPMVILHKQLGKDRLNYIDIEPEYITQNLEDAMVTWCSRTKNTCAVTRAFQGDNGVIVVQYLNKAPHYSQNMFGQWSNILSTVELHKPTENQVTSPKRLIEL